MAATVIDALLITLVDSVINTNQLKNLTADIWIGNFPCRLQYFPERGLC